MPDPNNVALQDHGICFMLLPKVANTSIKHAIFKALGRTPPEDVHDRRALTYVSRETAATFPVRIAFTRDPLDRLASCYANKVQTEFVGKLGRWGIRREMSFEEFVGTVARIPDADCTGAAQHFRGQAWDLCVGGTVIPTHLWTFERLAEDWGKAVAVCKKRGLTLPQLTHELRSGEKPSYTPRARAWALQRYRDDVRIFHYQPSLKHTINPDYVSRGRSICNVTREAYRLARDEVRKHDPELASRLMDLNAEQFDQAKRMNRKLVDLGGKSQYEAE